MLDLKQLQPQYIVNDAGERTGVILSMEDYAELLEDIEDLAAIVERKDEPRISHEELVAELRRDGLLSD